MVASPEYVPTICQTMGMKIQAVSEVTKSTGFKALEDKLSEAIEATQRKWASHFVFPIQDMNDKVMQKRFQLSFCLLLLMATKGFSAQVGMEGYDANAAIMDLIAVHGNEVVSPSTSLPMTSS